MVWWLAMMPCLLKCSLPILIQSLFMLTLTKSECNQTKFEEVCTHIDIILAFQHTWSPTFYTLEPDYLTTGGIIEGYHCVSQTWFHSPDGGSAYTLLDISSSDKYILLDSDTLQLNFDAFNIDESDEGVYGCLLNGVRFNQFCVRVYGEAVFASCPKELTCNEIETFSVPEYQTASNGDNIEVDATVTYIRGGNCGYIQNISYLQLIKELDGIFSVVLYSAYFSKPYADYFFQYEQNSVRLSRGNSGFEFILTLYNVTTDDIGMYRIEVGRVDPWQTYLTKKFQLVGNITPTFPQPTDTIGHSRSITIGPNIIESIVVGALIVMTVATTILMCAWKFVAKRRKSIAINRQHQHCNLPLTEVPILSDEHNIIEEELEDLLINWKKDIQLATKSLPSENSDSHEIHNGEDSAENTLRKTLDAPDSELKKVETMRTALNMCRIHLQKKINEITEEVRKLDCHMTKIKKDIENCEARLLKLKLDTDTV